MKSKIICLLVIAIFAGMISVNAQVSSVNPAQSTVCCEKTNWGAWCQNAAEGSCDKSNGLLETPASCEATSFCKLGCCYDSNEGTCMENTPQKVCDLNSGTWADSASCQIPQCNLGCCVLDNQAAFTTLVRCKKLSAQYGLTTNFRTDITSETDCVATAQAQDRGACVFEQEFTTTCKFTTKGDCDAMQKTVSGNGTVSNVTFHKDFLCTAEELGTNCNMQDKTMCIPGKDEVYFVDTCGNPANIYDASKRNDKAYWRKIISKADSCGSSSSSGNANSPSCGNCDYFSGSFCRQYDSTKDTRPTYGDNVCRDLNCKNTIDGNNYKHGESWCVYDSATGGGQDLAGSRSFKHVCIAGEEIVEPCADFRQEVCFQDTISTDKGPFQQAACIVNRWQDCTAQTKKDDCTNTDKRDCRWIDGVIGQDNLVGNQTNASSSSDSVDELHAHGVCVPDVPPGLNFWTAGEAEGVCAQGNAQCMVQFDKKLIGSKTATANAECLDSSWTQKRQEVCQAIGDCSGTKEECADGKCSIKPGVWSVIQSGFGVSGTK